MKLNPENLGLSKLDKKDKSVKFQLNIDSTSKYFEKIKSSDLIVNNQLIENSIVK